MIIPKIIFQTNTFRPPTFQVETIKYMSNGWEYKHFIDSEIIDFIKENVITGLEDSVSVFNKLNGAHKADFFRYYFLYLFGGVFVDSDARLEMQLDKIINKNISFFTVKSSIDNCKIFNGFIGAIPGNQIIYESLKWIYTNVENITDYFDICRNLNDNIVNDTLLFKEETIDGVSKITNDNNELILSHYFNSKIIEPITNPITSLTSPKLIKIGITFNLPKNFGDLYCSGINQHTLFFCELLLNAGYDVYLIVSEENLKKTTELKKILYDHRFKIANLYDIFQYQFDIVIDFGFVTDEHIFKQLKLDNTKVIAHKCGNDYLITTEDIIYNLKGRHLNKSYLNYDQIWSIPQMMNQNKHYWEILHKTECIEVPFIWSNKLIDEKCLYKNRPGNKKIGILEPNLSLMKCAIPPVLICENAYRKNKNIDCLYITNITKDNENFNLEKLTTFVSSFDLHTDKKITVEPRINSLSLMHDHCVDIVVSHQWENPLNYLYFDLAWMGWPVVHNAHMCKDIGYFYHDFNYSEGSDVLMDVIENHHHRADEYLVNNRKLIDRYIPSNKCLQDKYIKLIANLINL